MKLDGLGRSNSSRHIEVAGFQLNASFLEQFSVATIKSCRENCSGCIYEATMSLTTPSVARPTADIPLV